MERYLKRRTPILAVNSTVYFKFQIRRMRELQNAQVHLSGYRPANYGTITSLLMHMMRHVPHSPQASADYLKAALVEVSFDKVMERFGTFFLQDLDLEHAHMPRIIEEDNVECLAVMSRNKSLTHIKKERRAAMIEATGVDEPTEQFPIGNAPSWNEIVSAIEQHPTLLISEWIWNDKWGSKSTAARLFVDFTIDYFLTLSSDALTPLGFSKPKDLKDAMELWTVRALLNILNVVSFKASNHGLVGKVNGKRHTGFMDLANVFFPVPELDIRKDSVWNPFLEKGYIKEFHETMDELTDRDSSSLIFLLQKIFGRLQCLPSALPCSTRTVGRLWEQFDGGVKMLTNPISYKIEMIGKAKRTPTARGKQIKASRVIIEARLDEQHRNIPFNEGRLKARKVKKLRKRVVAKRSRKTNNYRKPPIRRKNNGPSTTSPGESDTSDDERVHKKLPIQRNNSSRSSTSPEEIHDSDNESGPNAPAIRVLRRRIVVSDDEDDADADNEVDELDEDEDELEEEYQEEEDEEEDEDMQKVDYMDVDDEDEMDID